MGRLRAGSFPIDLLAASILVVTSVIVAPGGWAPWLAAPSIAALAWLAMPPRRGEARKVRGRSGRRVDPAAATPRPTLGLGPAPSLR
jgi:hypothetical protein